MSIMNNVYTTLTEAIERAIVASIEGTGVVEDARAEYDIDAIAAEVIFFDVDAQRYAVTEDVDAFWAAVERHTR